MNMSDILTQSRTVCRAPGISKKRVFETIAKVICDDEASMQYNDVLDKLIAREELGSTALGQGIAIPHCRVDHCAQPMGTLLTLEDAIPFDAPDEQPVDLLFILLVPAEAHQTHLDILADIARRFGEEAYCQQLRAAQTDNELYAAFNENRLDTEE